MLTVIQITVKIINIVTTTKSSTNEKAFLLFVILNLIQNLFLCFFIINKLWNKIILVIYFVYHLRFSPCHSRESGNLVITAKSLPFGFPIKLGMTGYVSSLAWLAISWFLCTLHWDSRSSREWQELLRNNRICVIISLTEDLTSNIYLSIITSYKSILSLFVVSINSSFHFLFHFFNFFSLSIATFTSL